MKHTQILTNRAIEVTESNFVTVEFIIYDKVVVCCVVKFTNVCFHVNPKTIMTLSCEIM